MKPFNDIPYIIHGSEDSIDIDAFFIMDKEDVDFSNLQETKLICEQLSSHYGFNGNLVTVNGDTVDQCYKGSVDEVNNGMLYTYHLHQQKYHLPIKNRVERDIDLKMLRTIRGILTMFSRTEMRLDIKRALRSGNLYEKIEVLKYIDFTKEYNFSSKGDKADIYKFFAFQLGQTVQLSLGTEIYTKHELATQEIDIACFLYREFQPQSLKYIDHLFGDFLSYISHSMNVVHLNEDYIENDYGLLSVKDEKYVKK